MGLLPNSIEAIVREHTYHAIAGDVLLIGRQAIYLSPKEALQLVNRCGVPTPSNCVSDIAVDRTTRDRLLAYQDKELISDAAFFRLLGVNCVNALDHTSYEGAEVIHDLRYVLPDELKASADFVVDGSTLDNTFDPALTLKNLAALLRPGGRLITINMASNHREPYTIPTPLWYLDYFVMNGFADCKVYIVLYMQGMDRPDIQNTFCINLDCLQNPRQGVRAFTSPYETVIIVFAERSVDSTIDVSPTQQHYRSGAEWEVYRRNLARIQQNPRPHLARSRDRIRFFDVQGGHLFMDSEGNALDPLTEIRRTSLL
jgi:hypothetical protein